MMNFRLPASGRSGGNSQKGGSPMKEKESPIWQKAALTLSEAAEYSGIGINKLRKISNKDDCPFVLFIGTKRLIKRKKLDEYIDKSYSI